MWTEHLNGKIFRPSKILPEPRKDVFERRTSTGSGPFSFLGSGFAQIFGQIVSTRIKTLNTRQFKSGSLKAYYKGKGVTSTWRAVAQKRLFLSSLFYITQAWGSHNGANDFTSNLPNTKRINEETIYLQIKNTVFQCMIISCSQRLLR